MASVITLILTIIITCLIMLIFKKKSSTKFMIFFKIITVLFCAIGFFRFLLSDGFIWIINGSFYGDTYYNQTDILQSILRWGYYLNYIILPMAIFFKSPLFRNIAIYFCLPFTILSMFFFTDFMQYFMDPLARGLKPDEIFRTIYFGLELILAAIIPALLFFKEKHRFNFRDKVEIRNFCIALPLILLQVVPIYLPQSLFGFTSVLASPLSLMNFVWIAIMLLQLFALYYFFRFKNYRIRYQVVIFLALVLFFEYNSMYLMGFSISRLPLQLCNLGAYLFLIALIFKWRPLFNFAFLANTVGTIIAILMPDISGGIFGFWNVHFLYEHMLVFIIPILALALRIFPRIKVDALKHFAIGFAIYFAVVLVAGTILNGFSQQIGQAVNYFYIFDLEKAFGYFSFLRWSGDIVLRMGPFVLYPVFQLAIYLGFQFLVWLFYLLVQKMFKVADDKLALRKSRIDLYEKITRKKSKAPIDFID